jgi:hypothetical protein
MNCWSALDATKSSTVMTRVRGETCHCCERSHTCSSRPNFGRSRTGGGFGKTSWLGELPRLPWRRGSRPRDRSGWRRVGRRRWRRRPRRRPLAVSLCFSGLKASVRRRWCKVINTVRESPTKRTALEHPALCTGTPCSVRFLLPPRGVSLGKLSIGPVDSPNIPPFCPPVPASVPLRVPTCFKEKHSVLSHE